MHAARRSTHKMCWSVVQDAHLFCILQEIGISAEAAIRCFPAVASWAFEHAGAPGGVEVALFFLCPAASETSARCAQEAAAAGSRPCELCRPAVRSAGPGLQLDIYPGDTYPSLAFCLPPPSCWTTAQHDLATAGTSASPARASAG